MLRRMMLAAGMTVPEAAPQRSRRAESSSGGSESDDSAAKTESEEGSHDKSPKGHDADEDHAGGLDGHHDEPREPSEAASPPMAPVPDSPLPMKEPASTKPVEPAVVRASTKGFEEAVPSPCGYLAHS